MEPLKYSSGVWKVYIWAGRQAPFLQPLHIQNEYTLNDKSLSSPGARITGVKAISGSQDKIESISGK